MPYITEHSRGAVIGPDNEVRSDVIQNPGELNFAITHLLIQYVRHHHLNYETLNAVVGAVESAKQEFIRRVVSPYEDRKRADNGDAYPVTLLSK